MCVVWNEREERSHEREREERDPFVRCVLWREGEREDRAPCQVPISRKQQTRLKSWRWPSVTWRRGIGQQLQIRDVNMRGWPWNKQSATSQSTSQPPRLHIIVGHH